MITVVEGKAVENTEYLPCFKWRQTPAGVLSYQSHSEKSNNRDGSAKMSRTAALGEIKSPDTSVRAAPTVAEALSVCE